MKSLTAKFLFLAGSALLAGAALAQTYPTKTIRLIVPYGAGNPTDATARQVAQHMSTALGQQIFVENKPGANGLIGSQQVAKAAPDGYTIGLAGNGSHSGAVALYKSLPYDPLKDFQTIGMVAGAPWVLVTRPDFPANNLAEFVAHARANPGKVSVGHLSASTLGIAGLFEAGTKLTLNRVSYGSSGQATIDLAAGRLDATFLNPSAVRPLLQAGKLKAFGISQKQPAALLPQVPSMVSYLPGEVEFSSWIGLVAPAGTPEPVVRLLSATLMEVMARPDVQSWFHTNGMEPLPMDPAQFSRRMADDVVLWKSIVTLTGIQPQ